MTEPLSRSTDTTAAPIDLTGIDPVQWATTRERVEVLRTWCAAERHTRGQAEAAAARLGLTVKHFYRLVSAWKKHRDARLVSGRTTPTDARPGPRPIDARARGVLDQVVERLGPRTDHGTTLTEVRRLCAAEGIDPPSAGTVHYALMRARRSPNRKVEDDDDAIVVSSIICLLPIDSGSSTLVAPDLVLAVRRSSARIVAHRLVLDEDVIDAARHVLDRLVEKERVPIIVAANLAAALDDGIHHVRHADVRNAGNSTLLARLIGDRIGDIAVRHRRSRRRSTSRWTPLSPSDALLAVDRAAVAHNAGRAD